MHAKKNTFSMTHIKEKARRKTNPIISETISVARKQKAWFKVAHILSGATRRFVSVNLNEIERQTKAGDTVLVLGKVLSSGNLTKKVKICALSISSQAREKLSSSKSEFVTVLNEIKSNAKMEGVKLIK